ncbi:MAG TPA: GGDEF domain-containing protein [Thermoanaerobaculia bacterium]|nr:GGDEF domain-containing protein [Thermoanaerobaculia bacterium]
MELLLWRWSTTAQIASSLTIAIFFFVLTRSVKRRELRPWLYAWTSNLGALAVTVIFWYSNPSTRLGFALCIFGYMACKTAFVVYLAAGARGMGDMKPAWAMIIVGAAAIGAALITKLDVLGVVESTVIALVLAIGARAARPWLAAGFCVRALLAISEALAHATRVFPNPWSTSKPIGLFLASYSSFDTGAEWIIALACVLMLYRTIQSELMQSNADLLAAQAVLQELVDHDPLTGLLNRRALPGVLRKCFESGATILFFDVNDFKSINDSYGHQAGDEALKQFARALEGSFRPEDHVIRYSGDEFVVVAPAATPERVIDRLEQVRERLRFERSSGPLITFSAGHAYLPVNGKADEALRAADEAMYRQKSANVRRLG